MGICTVAAAEEAVAAQVVHAAVVGVDKAAREASEEAAERVGPGVGGRAAAETVEGKAVAARVAVARAEVRVAVVRVAAAREAVAMVEAEGRAMRAEVETAVAWGD